VDTLDAGSLADVFGQHEALVCGTPTWNTGADTERSGTGWDDLYYDKLPELKSTLENKKVAVFGLGDQSSYGENYADAAGELYDVFESLGCDMVPYAATSQEGYEHEASKSIRGDKFCGLLLDQINQDELTDERVQNWVAQLQEGGFLEGGGGGGTASATTSEAAAAAPAATAAPDLPDVVNVVNAGTVEEPSPLADGSSVLDQNIGTTVQSSEEFTPHYNPVTGKTMWTSPDGRSSYVTIDDRAIATQLRP